MSGLFIGILDMSISASCVALIVMLIRLALRKAPKIYSYALWAVVFFRLICPFTIQLPVSAIPVLPQTIPYDIVYSESPAIQSGVPAVDYAVNNAIERSLPPSSPAESVNPVQVALEIGAYLWTMCVLALLLYGIISYLRLKRRVTTAIRVHDNIYETDLIKTPFVLGFIHAKIYVPTGLSANEIEYVIEHERTHIRRLDYLIKPLAFLATSVYWFNPIIWFSYALMVKDMELSADESVMKHYDFDIRGDYANSLLALSVKKSGLLSPLAFGETGVKERVKNVLNYKKPAFWVSVTAIVIVAAVSTSLIVSKQTEGAPTTLSNSGHASSSALSGTSEAAYTTEYSSVKISFSSDNKGVKSPNAFEATDPQVVVYIDSTIRTSLPSKQKDDLENNHTNQYTIKLSNKIGGYSCGLYYDTLYDKAYIVKDGGSFDIGTDFARYIDSLFENTNISFNVDKTDAALFKKYEWTLDYQISEMKNKLNDISTLSDFNPNAYYFAYNNELSKDIGLDMSQYSNNADLDVKVYRIHESMPQEFHPIQNCRGIIVKTGDKIIGAFVSAGRHSAFNACSLKGNGFESVTGKTIDEWLANKVKADSTEERLSKLEPEQVIKEYFTALNNKDAKSAKYCISKKTLMENLTVNMPNEELFNEGIGLPLTDADIGAKSIFDNLKSAKLSKIELIKKSDKSTGTFRVYVNLQYNKEVTIGNGEQSWDCSMVYESPQTGWKIEGFGHG